MKTKNQPPMKKVLTLIFLCLGMSCNSYAQSALKVELSVDLSSEPLEYNQMIFGQFLEHFHRQIYGGIYEPGSKLSDE